MLLFDPSSYPFEGVVYLAGVLYILQHLVNDVLDQSTRGEELKRIAVWLKNVRLSGVT